jgi:gliding motility-associated-like protein
MIKRLLSFLLLSLLAFNAKATHIIGSTLTYVHNGGSSYTFTLKLYRDCGAGSAAYPNNVTINVRGLNGVAFTPSKDFTMPGGTITNIPSNLDTCAVPPTPMPCVQERIYTATVTNLPPNVGGYHCYYQVCCRNLSTTNVNATCNCIGSSVYTYIPGPTGVWMEDFTLANGTTTDAGTTAWTRTTTAASAQVNNNLFESNGANNGLTVWTSQVINIAAYTSGVTLSVVHSETSNLEAGDSVRTYFSLNGGPLTLFPTNGNLSNDFTTITATTGVLVGNTVQIVIRHKYDGASGGEILQSDNVNVIANNFQSNSSPSFNAFPPLFLCQGNVFNFNHAATDPDGDSLVYSFYTPYNDVAPTFPANTATFTPVTWLGGFSATNPLGGAPLTLVPTTGMMSGTPPMTGQFVVGVRVREYRNSVLLNEVTRDFQFNITFCPAPAQALIVPGDTINACSGLTVSFPNNSDPAANNWTWNFGNTAVTTDTSTLEFPTYSFPSPGTYTTMLIINAGTSCADTSYASVDVGFANANFTHNAPQCAGTNVSFTNSSTCSANTTISGYSWNFGDSQTSNATNPTHAYATGGTYTVTLITYTALGCTDTLQVPITITPTPATPTATSNSPVCSGSTITLSTPAVSGGTYSWTGPSAFTSTLQNPTRPSATAGMAGTYSVTVTAGGCTSAAGTVNVVVNPTPAAPTATSNAPICAGSTLNLSASNIAGATYSWTGPNSFTSALQNPSIPAATIAASGTYSVTATVAGCTSSAGTIAVTVSPQPATPAPSSNSPVCAGNTINLSTPAVVGATYSWTGPNGFTSALQNPTVTNAQAANAGTYSVTVTVGGCPSNAGTVSVVVNPTPATPAPTSNSPICTGSTINLSTPAVVGATYSWTGPSAFTSTLQNPTRPSATLAMSGTYSVTVTVGGCTSAIGTVNVTVNPTPAAPTASSNSPICAGSNLNLTATNVVGATYTWTGPNSFSSTTQNPTISGATTAASGTYSVTVTVAGCTSVAGTTAVTVNPIPATPTAGSNSPVCTGNTITLTTPAVVGATYSWTGPSAFTSTLQNPTRPGATLAMAGTYSVSVTQNGCSSAAGTVNVVVNATPSAPVATSNSPICAGSTLNLSASNIVGATYSWTGPNSFSSSLQNPSISNATTAASGTYSVTASVAGCPSAFGTVAVTVNPIPATPAPTSNSPICVGQTLNLNTTAVVGATYSWTGPNSFSSSLQNPSITGVTSAAAGTYSLTVTVNGCASSIGTVVCAVNTPPAAPTVSSNSPVCTGTTLNLTSNLVSGATYSWSGPNSFTSTLQNPSITNVTAAAAGTYTLIINNGCASSPSTIAVTVNTTPATPTAGNNSPICDGSTLNLTASNLVGATYSWSGPASFSSTSQNPSITGATSANAGTYSVTVTLNGCTSAFGTTTAVINPIPTAPSPGSNSPVCTGNTINLTTPAVPGATYSWTGPSSFTSTLQNPTRPNATLAMAGTYSVTVTVLGCTSAAGTVNVVVNPTPIAPSASSNSPLCDGDALNLTASNIVGATYSWSGPNSFTSGNQNPSVSPITTADAGTYSVTATVNGCVSAAGTTNVIINPIPSTPTATSNGPICSGQTLTLSTPAVVGATYSWSGPNSFSSTLQNPTITSVTTAASGTYSVTITVNGCTSSAGTIVVLVSNNPPSPNVTSNTPICSGQTLQLNADTIAGVTYSWTGPNGFSSSNQNPTIPNATTAASGTYTVTVFNGCSSAPASVTVVVNPTPATPVANSNSPICSGTTLNLTSNLIVGATYTWTGPNSFSSSVQNPSIPGATSTEAGTYSVTVTVNGCVSNVGTEIVTVDPVPVAIAGSSQSVCANNAIVALAGTSTTGNGTWTSSGTGTFTPAANILNPTYTPSNADTAAGSVVLTFTTTNNGACTSDNDQITITFTDAPIPNAGSNQTVCANNATVNLNGAVTIATGGIWSTSGTGTFSPSASALNTSYIPSTADTAAGTVTLYLTTTGNGSCLAASDSIVITITDAPIVNAGATIFRCSNNPNATLGGSSSTGSATWTTSGTGSFNPNANTLNAQYIPSPTDLASGSVLLTLTSTANGLCNAVTDTVSVIYTQPPVVSANVDQTLCANAGPVILAGSSTTGFGTWTTSGTGTFAPNALNGSYGFSPADTAAGSVVLTLTSTNNGGCLAVTDQMIITITDAPIVTAGADISVCANNAVVNLNGSVTVATGGVWSTTGTGSFSPGASSLNASYSPTTADTAAGAITIYLTSTGNGTCLATIDSLLVTFTDAPYVVAGDTILTCISSPNTPLSGTSTTGSGVWTTLGSGSFTPNNTTLNATYVPSTADTLAGQVQLILTSTNNGTCNSEDDTVLVIFAPVPSVTTTPDQTVCANNAIVVVGGTSTTGSGIWTTSGSGAFSPSATNLNPTYTPSAADTAAGTVTLTFTSTNGCTPISSTITITITDAPVVNAGADIFTCANNPNATLNGSIGGATTTGVWTTSGSGGFIPNNSDLNATYIPSSADTASGSVMLVLTSTGNGLCNAESDTMILTITPPPTATAGPDLVACANNAVGLGGAISGGSGTGIWTTPNGAGTFAPSNTSLGAVYIPVNADTLASPIMIILTSTGNGGCLASADTLLITVNPGPEVNAGPDQTVCANNATVGLSGTYYLSTGIEWSSNGDGTFSPDTISATTTYQPGPMDTANGSVTIYLSSTGNGLCSAAIDSLIVTITDAPVINAGADQTICTGITSATLSGSVTGGASTALWTTSGSGTFVPNDSTLNASYVFSSADTTTGSVTLYLTSTNNGLCVAEMDSMTITITPVPVALAGNDTTVCENAAGLNLNGIILGGNGTGIWSTSGDGTFTPNDSTLNATYIPGTLDTANGTVTLVLNATNACLPQSDTVTITLIDAPTVEAGSSALICAGENVILAGQVSNTTGGTWSTSGDGTFTPSATSMNATYVPGPNDIAGGTATITLTADSTGFCSSVTDQITVTINSTPVADFLYSGTCDNTMTLFNDTSTNVNGAIVSWNWAFDVINSDTAQDPTFQFGTAGTHTVTLVVVTAAGCADTLTQTLMINASPQAAYSDTTVCPTDGIYTDQSTIASGVITTWQWTFGDSTSSALQSPTHTYADTGMYIVTLTVTSDSGCVTSFSDTTFIDVCSDDVTDPVLPSAFTPNGDGHNDVFIVRGGPMQEMELRIYNEWGNLIFTSTTQTDGWDGTYKSKPQPAGTYVWTLVGTTADGNPINLHGSVTLMR